MKFKPFGRFATLIVSVFFLVCGIFTGEGYDSLLRYRNTIKKIDCYENTLETAIPQTDIYKIIQSHFDSDLPEGKTVKKAIVIGYDGGRADALSLMNDEKPSAIGALLNDGGHALLAYCGGTNFPDWHTQATSTAPGWCDILTGVWGDVSGVVDNGIVKSSDTPSLFTSLIEDGDADSTAFFVSWKGHFTNEDSTYIAEKKYAEEKNLNVLYSLSDDDDGTKAAVLNNVKGENCADFVFAIFEYPDHIGHDKGFSIYNKYYPNAFYDAEATGLEVINTIKARSTYAQEDWLILIASDHGGNALGHGNSSIMERMTFVVSNKDIIL